MVSDSPTRQRILESARDLIYSRSYADVGVAAICNRAEVKKGSFYHFFASKQELTLAVIDEFILELKEHIFRHAFAVDLAPLERFERMIEMVYVFQVDMAKTLGRTLGCPFGNLAAEMSTQDEAIRDRIALVFQQMEEHFQGALDEAVEKGDVSQDVDIPATAMAMLAYVEGLMLLAKNQNDPEVIKQLGPAMVNIRILQS